MVAKISIGSSLYGALAYNAQKVNAGEGKLLAVNRVFDGGDGRMDCARLLRDFCNCMPENIRTRNTVIHISLNPHPDDRKTAETAFRGTPTGEKQQKLRFGAPRRAKKRKKLQIPWAESSEIDENCEFRGRNHQKSAKTANSVDGIIRNRRKLQIPWTESSKNDENCEFRGQNHQKTEKTGFPHPGENQNHPFSAFPHPYNFLLTNYLVEK